MGYATRHDLGTSNSDDRIVNLLGLGVAVIVDVGRRVLVGSDVLVIEGFVEVNVFVENGVEITV